MAGTTSAVSGRTYRHCAAQLCTTEPTRIYVVALVPGLEIEVPTCEYHGDCYRYPSRVVAS